METLLAILPTNPRSRDEGQRTALSERFRACAQACRGYASGTASAGERSMWLARAVAYERLGERAAQAAELAIQRHDTKSSQPPTRDQ